MYNSVVILGLGKMGKIWANSFYETGCSIEGIIEPEAEDDFHEKFDSKIYQSIEECSKAEEADIWVIATPTSEHFKYSKKALKNKIPMVLLEKPATSNPKDTKELAELSEKKKTKICVDYTEKENPAVKSVVEDMGENFNLSQAIHRRGKKAPFVVPYIMDDIIHDFSEIMTLYKKNDKIFSDIEIEDIKNIYSWSESDNELSSNLENIYDAGVSMHLRGPDKELINMRGGYDYSFECRYFCWIDEKREKAYLVNTLTENEDLENNIPLSKREIRNSEKLTSFSAKIEGRHNINTILHNSIEENFKQKEDFEEILQKTEADMINPMDKTENYPDQNISKKIKKGIVSPATISEAAEIELMIKKIYQETSRFNQIYKI